MTALTNQPLQNVYGDLLTTTNNGAGLNNVLHQLQDGFGNSSTVTIATNAINFNRMGGNTFQLDNIALTASATNINAICGVTPAFPAGTAITLPLIAADPVGAAGMMYYNTTLNAIRAYITGPGWTSLNHTP